MIDLDVPFRHLCEAQAPLTYPASPAKVQEAIDATVDALVALYAVQDELRGVLPGQAMAQVITDALEGEGG